MPQKPPQPVMPAPPVGPSFSNGSGNSSIRATTIYTPNPSAVTARSVRLSSSSGGTMPMPPVARHDFMATDVKMITTPVIFEIIGKEIVHVKNTPTYIYEVRLREIGSDKTGTFTLSSPHNYNKGNKHFSGLLTKTPDGKYYDFPDACADEYIDNPSFTKKEVKLRNGEHGPYRQVTVIGIQPERIAGIEMTLTTYMAGAALMGREIRIPNVALKIDPKTKQPTLAIDIRKPSQCEGNPKYFDALHQATIAAATSSKQQDFKPS